MRLTVDQLQARRFLLARFREQRSWRSQELHRLARADGLSADDLRDARIALPIAARMEVDPDGARHWAWVAHEGWPSN